MNYQKELDVIIPLIKEAGEEIMKIYEGEIKVEVKGDNSPVTQADLLSNDIIVNKLTKEFPNYAILSEEIEDDGLRFKCDKVFVIDPIDGTKGFIKRNGEFSIHIGMLDKSKPVLGVVYAPALDKLYYATKGSGTFLDFGENTSKLDIKLKNSLSDAKILVSKNHFTSDMQDILDNIKSENIVHIGGNGVKFGAISEGIADFDFKTTSQLGEWDTCAPQVILEEAGGFVYGCDGRELEYNTKNKKISNGYIATSIDNKELILKAIGTFRE